MPKEYNITWTKDEVKIEFMLYIKKIYTFSKVLENYRT